MSGKKRAGGGKQGGEGAVLRGLDTDGVNTVGFGVAAHLVEKDGFAHAP